MNQDDGPLSRFLLLYKLIEEEPDTDPILHIQVYPGCGDYTSFKLLHEKQFEQIEAFYPSPYQSLPVEEGAILFVRATSNDYVTAGGIWQVKWMGNEDRYVLVEVSSSGIEMAEVEELLSEEELSFFENAVSHAKDFIEVKEDFSTLSFKNGREIGIHAPEVLHRNPQSSYDIYNIEHIWHIVLWEYSPNVSKYYLLEVTYHLQQEEWQYTVKLLEEQGTSLLS